MSVRHEHWKFWSSREWKPVFDLTNSPEFGTPSSCCCVEFRSVCMWVSLECWQSRCWCSTEICTLRVGRQKVWSFCKCVLLLFTSCLLALRLLIAYCMELAAGWFALAWLYLCYGLWLSHSSIVVVKCFVVFIIVILSWLVTFDIALLIVLLLYNLVFLRDNRHCKSNVFNGLLKRPLDVFTRGRLWTLMVGHRCNGDLNEQ